MQRPGRRHLRPDAGGSINAAITSVYREPIEAAGDADAAIAAIRSERAVDAATVDAAISCVQGHIAMDAVRANGAVARSDLDVSGDRLELNAAIAGGGFEVKFTGNRELNMDGMMHAADKVHVHVGRFHGDDDVVARLVFVDANVVGADLITLGGDARDDLLLIGGRDVDVAIVRVNLQVRAAGNRIRFRPVIGVRSGGG